MATKVEAVLSGIQKTHKTPLGTVLNMSSLPTTLKPATHGLYNRLYNREKALYRPTRRISTCHNPQ